MSAVPRSHGRVRAGRFAESGGVANVGKLDGRGEDDGKIAHGQRELCSLCFIVGSHTIVGIRTFGSQSFCSVYLAACMGYSMEYMD